MNDFLNYIFLDNTVRDLLISAAIILVVLIIKRLISRYLAGLLCRLITRFDKNFNELQFQKLVLTPIETFLMILALVIAGERLKMPATFRFEIWHISLAGILESLSVLALIISFIWLCLRVVEFIGAILHDRAMLTDDRGDDQLVIFFKDLVKVLIGIVGGLLIFKYTFHQPLGQILTGISIVGAALALAFRESLENLIASFIIFFDKPFTTGDTVKVQSVNGTVERIGLRSTRIRTIDKTFVTVPNKVMVDSILDNQSLRTQRNVLVTLKLHLLTTPQQIQNVVAAITKMLQHHEHIIDNNVYFSDTGADAYFITVEYFVTVDIPIKQFNKVKEDVNLGLTQALAQQGVRLAATPAV
jgi:MscS family membrane protein